MRKLALLLFLLFSFFASFLAFLQSDWAKESLRSYLTQALEKRGVQVQIEAVEGAFPQTLTLQGVQVQTGPLTLSVDHLKLQVSLLRLIKKELAFNFVHAEGIRWEESADKKEMASPADSQQSGVSFPIYVQQLICKRVQIPHSFLCEGEGRFWIGPKEGFLEAKIRRLDFPESSADLHIKLLSNQTLKMQADIQTATLHALNFNQEIDGNLKLKVTAKAPLSLLWDRSAPLQGKIQGTLLPTQSPLSPSLTPLIHTPWSFSTRFQQQKNQPLFFSQMYAKNDLFTLKGDLGLNEQGTLRQGLFELQSSHFLERFFPSVEGRVFASLHLQREEPGLKASLFWNIPSLKAPLFTASQIQGTIEALEEETMWRGKASLGARVEGEVWEGKTDFAWSQAGALAFSKSVLKGPHVEATSEQFSLEPDASYEGNVHLAISNLHALRFLFPQVPVYGTFSADATFHREEEIPKVRLEAQASDFYYGPFFAEELFLQADLAAPYLERDGSVLFQMQKGRYKDFRFDSARFNTASNPLHWPFQLVVDGQIKHPLHMEIEGFWKLHSSEFLATIQSIQGTFLDHPLSLEYPVSVEISPSFVRCKDLQIQIAEATLSASLDHKIGSTDLSLQAKQLPLDFLSLNPLDVQIGGLIDFEANLKERNQSVSGTFSTTIQEMEVTTLGQTDPLQANGAFQGFLDAKRFDLQGGLNVRQQPLLALQISLPVQASLWPFEATFLFDEQAEAKLHFDGHVEDILDFFDLGTHHVSGICHCDLQMHQTLAHPSLEGTCLFEEGTYQNYYTGTDLTALKANLIAKDSRLLLQSLTGQDSQNKGHLEASGELIVDARKDFPFHIDAQFSQLNCVQIDLVTAEAEGKLHIEGDARSATATGTIELTKSELTIPDKLPASFPNLQVVYLNASKPIVTPPSPSYQPYPFYLDVEVKAPDGVFIVGRGLNSEWKGEFTLGGTFTELKAKGKLELISGEFVFSSRQFKLNQGALSLSGKEHEMPYLDIAGTIDQKGVTITAHLKGPLNRPQLTFQSSPPLPLSSIMSHLLFGQDLSEISGFQALQLATSIASIAGEGADVMENTRRSLGVDRLQVVSAPGSEEGDDTIALQVGKYVTKGVIVTYTQGAEDSSGNISIEVEIKDNFVFQAETQQTPEQQGKFTLKWTLNY